MRKLALALLTGVVALGAGLYLLVWRPLFALPTALPQAEQALATPDLLLLAGINAKQAVFLERWIMDTPAESPPATPPALAERGLLDHLRGAQVDPRRDLDYVLYAAYPSPQPGVRQAVALIGRFDPAAVGKYLTDELHAKAIPGAGAGPASYEVALTDPNSCKPAASWIVSAEPGSILIADPAAHAALASRLRNGAPGDAGDIRWWHELALADVAGVAIRRPAKFDPDTLPFPGMNAPELGIFERAYLGLGIGLAPPEGQLRLVLDAKDAGRAADQVKAWQKAVEESRGRWASLMPAVARLYDGLGIRTEGARSTLAVTIDRSTVARLQDLGNELVAQIFGGLGMSVGTQPGNAGAEQIDKDAPKFVPAASISALGPYDPNAQFAEKVDASAGPFGLRLDAIRLGTKPEDGLELVVAGFAGGIPNLAADPGRAKLIVDSVTSSGGEELLKREDCGRERNGKPAEFASALPPRLSASKTVHLIPGADAHALGRVAGHVVLRLPTKTDAVTIAEPKAGAMVEKYGARVSINQIAGGNLSYQITGERNRVLLIRALNAKREPLSHHMKMSGDPLFGSGLAGRTDYSGAIAALEVVFAAEEQSAEFPFALTNFSLAGEPRPLARDDTPEFQPYSRQALLQQYAKPLPPPEKPLPRLAVAQVEPFEIALEKAQPFFQLSLSLGVRAPDAPGFRRRFDLGQLQLTRVALKDGSVLTPPAAANAAPAQADRSVWTQPLRFMSAPKQGVLSASQYFSIDSKAKPEDLKSLEGSLALRFPAALETVRFDDLSVGQKVQSGDVTLTVAARGRQSLTLEASRGAERLVYVRLLDAQGQALLFSGPQVTALPDGGARFELSPFNAPARAEIVLAREMETETLPFTLALP
jgi:hypothetical protein